jgi:alpha-D-xyloside xylohydrolase
MNVCSVVRRQRRTGRPLRGAFLGLVVAGLLAGIAAPPAAAQSLQRLASGVAVTIGERRLEVQVCRDDVVRVVYAPPGRFFARESIVRVAGGCRPTEFEVQTGPDAIALTTRDLTARIALPGGAVSFFDRQGRLLLAEKKGGGKTMTPAEVMGESTYHIQAEFQPSADEALYGLGAHQSGLMNYAGRDVDMYQLNIVDIVPFLVSSHGYGLLWDNTSHTKFGDLKPPVHVPGKNLLDASGQPGGLTGTYRQGDCTTGTVVATRVDPQIGFGAPEDRPAISEVHNAVQAINDKIHPSLPQQGDVCVVWDGQIESEGAGDYDLMTFANNGIRLWVDGKLLVSTWRQGWLPWWDEIRLSFGARERHPIKLEWRKEDNEGTLRLKWKTPPRSPYTSLWSEVGDGIDYYFVYGPDLDDVVAGYRELTGRAPLMPRWALGLWQCRERYKTAQESLDVLAEFRRRQIPIDTIVQDWQYWREDQWGSHEFDPARFPDPAGWIRDIHDRYHAHLMISVWPKFYTGTENFRIMKEKGFLYPETLRRPTKDWLGYVHTDYDAFNPEARKLFWLQVNTALFSKGADAWWMDATEPELVGEGTPGALKAAMHPTYLGSGARMANAYVLASSQAVYEGQRSADPDKRVFMLTRSAFSGVQRYASATWSGDVSADWTSLRKQIAAGLNFALSGVPWWTTDIGGFTVPRKWSGPNPKPEDVEEWRELVTRWFQFGTFCSLLRVHGQYPNREMWLFGADEGHRAYQTQLAFDKLRYRMLPYAYSVAAAVTRRHATIMRPLVMDFQRDPEVLGIGDQFLFGPSLLVNPVTAPGATSRSVYLPRREADDAGPGAGWYDFWTGALLEGGRRVDAPAPYESMPIYVKAGSILPMGPDLQYVSEKPADPLTLWVYTGGDAAFELYEDDGVTYGYEKGAFATTPFRWDEKSGTLTIGERTGSFPGMVQSREIRVVFVAKGAPVGHSPSPPGARLVRYDGHELVVPARP